MCGCTRCCTPTPTSGRWATAPPRTACSRATSTTASPTAATGSPPCCSPGRRMLARAGELVIRRDSVQERLGRDWQTHEFQLNIVSYFGNIAEWDDDKIVIKWEH